MKAVHDLSDAELLSLARAAARLPDVPQPLVDAAIALGPCRSPGALERAAETAQAALRLVAAVLQFDSWAQPALASGMRAAPGDTRHLLFCAEGCDIDLRITPSAERFAVSGQVLGSTSQGVVEFAAAEVGLRSLFADSRTAALDEMGEFRLDALPAGTYRMTIKMGRDKIALPPIDIGARQRRA